MTRGKESERMMAETRRNVRLVRSLVLAFCGLGLLGYARPGQAQDCAEWIQRDVSGPSARANHALTYDTWRGVTVLFGGFYWDGSYHYDGGTWELDGNSWTQRIAVGPSPRERHAMAYDAARGVTVLFGGAYLDGVIQYYGDTWEWDGQTWTLRDTDGPAPRGYHGLAYDSARGVTVLFGGEAQNSMYFSDTWEWDGNTWTQCSADGPSPRRAHAMAYDAVREMTVLFGGGTGSGFYDDTWEWDGSTWTRRDVSGPAPRKYHAMAFDVAAGVSLLFGGYYPNYYSAETWGWDGSTWTLRGTGGPSARDHHAIAYDAAREVMVLFGGYYSDGNDHFHSDTWEWGWIVIIQSPASQTVSVGEAVTLTVQAEGTGTLTYAWRKDDAPLIDDERISGVTTDTLSIDPVVWSDAGRYDVVITGDYCSVTSEPATLTVISDCPGDITGDGHTDQADLGILLALWGVCEDHPNYDPAADLNGDGCINHPDLGILLADWGCGT